MPNELNFASLLGFDYRRNAGFTVLTHDLDGHPLEASVRSQRFGSLSERDIDLYLARFAPGGGATPDERIQFVAQLLEPISKVVPYVEMYNIFFVNQTLDDMEDNLIAVEDIVALAFETHPDQQVLYVRPGYSFTRPSFREFDAGIEINWRTMKKAGWNVLARSLNRAVEAIARKRDSAAYGVLRTAIDTLPSHTHNVTGGSLTKAAVDEVLKDQTEIGFPVTQVLVNGARAMDMGSFSWGGSNGVNLPDEEVRELLRTLVLMEYGQATWYTNLHAPTTELIFSGPPNQIGYHQTRGQGGQASETDMTQKVDRHAIYDPEHAWYVDNALPLARLTIGA